ncbi:MAG: GNAT family N-acetyltransferase [Polyangiales bacterium]
MARVEEQERLAALVARSFRALGAGHYSEPQIEAALSLEVIRVDRGLLEDGTYFAAELEGELVGCGGWSARVPTIQERFLPVPRGEVRAMFVAPEHAGRGVGRALLEAAEQAISAAGFVDAYLVATRSGLAFYERAGYSPLGEHAISLGDLDLPLTFMRRRLTR